MGIAEELREKARSLRSSNDFVCKDFVAIEFGISSPCKSPRRCCDCYADMFERIAGRIDAEMVEYERLKKENAELKAELADWKGNAEGFQPDAYMKLPLDADGEPIRIGDEMNIDGDAMTVLGYCLSDDMLFLIAEDKNSAIFFTPEPSRVRHFKPEPPDSWESLEEDAVKRVCEYAGAKKSIADADSYTCIECPYDEPGLHTDAGCHERMRLDLVRRAKALAKAGEQG